MEIIEIHGGLLTNIEVLQVLREQQQQQHGADNATEKGTIEEAAYSSSSSAVGRCNNNLSISSDANTALQNKLQVSEMTIKYISKSCPQGITQQSVCDMLKEIKSSGHLLTEAELMQIANTLPRVHVQFHAIIDDCEERFSDEEVEQIVAIVSRHCWVDRC